MQHLLVPGGWTIAAAIVFLGGAAAAFSCIEQTTRFAQRAVALVAPALAALLFLLFTDWLVFSVKDRWWLIFFAITVLATVLYFAVYQWLYRRRGGLIYSRSRAEAGNPSAIAPEIDLSKNRARFLAAWALSFFVAQPEISTGIGMRKRRQQLLVIWAFVPWLLFALYFAIVPYVAASTQTADDGTGRQDSIALPDRGDACAGAGPLDDFSRRHVLHHRPRPSRRAPAQQAVRALAVAPRPHRSRRPAFWFWRR